MIQHPIPPLFDAESRLLILGSFPSVKSRETAFFYGHPQNRFWRIMASILNEPLPETIADKKTMLLSHHIALWDVIGACEIVGSSDSSITDVVPNDLSVILNHASIQTIAVNGKTAEKYYRRYQLKSTGREALVLPSSSPANAAWTLPKLIEAWQNTLLR